MKAPKSSSILLLFFHFLIVLKFEDIFSLVPPINQYLFILNKDTFISVPKVIFLQASEFIG